MMKNDHHANATDYAAVVERHSAELACRPALRAMYAHWAGRIRRRLSTVTGRSVELGCGSNALAEGLPGLVRTDTHPHPWVDEVCDACAMPFTDGSCANLVAVDVVHHLPEPAHFFDECARVLAPGGRVVLLEPYISPGSYLIYKLGHHEPVDLQADPFASTRPRDRESDTPCNEAIPTLAFGPRGRRVLEERWPMLRFVDVEYSDGLLYLLTGGYSRPSLIPTGAVRTLAPLEDALLRRVGRFVGLRMLVVLEKRAAAPVG